MEAFEKILGRVLTAGTHTKKPAKKKRKRNKGVK